MTDAEEKKRRTIRSFVLRQGRLTKGQARAFEEQWPRFGIDFHPEALDLQALFDNDNPVHLEIGFGNGESLATMASQRPDINVIGIEVHGPGVGHLLMRIGELNLTNVRVCQHDAVEVLRQMIPPESLSGSYLFFPDPWHKKRHHKRRIVQPDFLELLASRLKPDGFFHAATDWENYAEHMLETLTAAPQFENTAESYAEKPAYRPLTKFEQRGLRLGHGVWDLVFRRR